MAKKSQTNPSRSKTTSRSKPSTAATSSTKRQPTHKGNQSEDKLGSEVNSESQPPAPTVSKDETVGLKNQPISPQTIELPELVSVTIQDSKQLPIHESVQGINELQQQFAALQEQLKAVQDSYAALQQTSTEQTKAIDTLQEQLAQRNLEQAAHQNKYSVLQQKAIEQTQTIEQLQDQITMLEQQIEHRLSDHSAQLLPDATPQSEGVEAVTIDVLNSVQQQVAGLQTEFNHQVMQQMTQQQRYEVLRRQFDEQSQLIAELRSLVTQEHRYAAIGEAHLNKWRYRTFSS